MQGQMTIILPEPTMADLADGKDGAALGPSLGSNMGNMRAELTAVLCKMRVPLNEFAGLKVGDTLPLDQAFLYETDLLTIGGQQVAQGLTLPSHLGSMAPALEGVMNAFGDDVVAHLLHFARTEAAAAAPILTQATTVLNILTGLNATGPTTGDIVAGFLPDVMRIDTSLDFTPNLDGTENGSYAGAFNANGSLVGEGTARAGWRMRARLRRGRSGVFM